MAKKKEYKDQSAEDLIATARDLDKEIYRLRNELALQRKLDKPHLLKKNRRDKARVLTALTQKQKVGAS